MENYLGVYILHESLGVRTVDDWNPKNNNGVVGILVVENGHKFVVALEDAPDNLQWSNRFELVNQPVENIEDAESDFNREYYCQKLGSPEYPAAYYCLNYKKSGKNWQLPTSGELWLIRRHLDDIQNALDAVGGQRFVTEWDEGDPWYWSSTEHSANDAWVLIFPDGCTYGWHSKAGRSGKVRPVSKYVPSVLKDSSVTKKDSSDCNSQTSDQSVQSMNISSNDSWKNIIDVYRKDGSIRKVSIMKDRNTGKFCFVNLTSLHVCKCRFETFEDAIADLKMREEVEHFDIHYIKDPII